MKYSLKTLNTRSDRGSLRASKETFSTNFVRESHERTAAIADSEIIEAALKILARRVARGSVLSSPRAAREYLALRFGEVEHEVFAALYLDKRHRLIACEELFRGTIDGASVHPRIVVKEALRHNAAALIITHNHPLCFVWGVTTPVIGHCVRMECANPSSDKEGNGEFCPVSSDRITPVSPSRRLRCSRARARSSTRRVAVRPACDGCAAA